MSSGSASHKKFDDDDENGDTSHTEYVSANETSFVSEKKRPTFLSDDDDDDDAPEEEGMEDAKKLQDDEMKLREEALQLEKDLLKSKRRKQNEFFNIQKKSVKESKTEVEKNEQEESMLESLPEDFLNKLDEEEELQTSITHINFDDIDSSFTLTAEDSEEIKTQLKKRKKKTLKNLRKTTAKKGPVTVSVLSNFDNLSNMAPKRESSIMNTKDKWLKRKAIKRK